MMDHPLHQFRYCPKCGAETFAENDEKSKVCRSCGFVYYFNPSAAVACFIRNAAGEWLVVRRGKEPARGTLDLPGGFVDLHETAEEAVAREVREETGLHLESCRYLCSLPNIYRYSGFDVHTLDLFYVGEVADFSGAVAADDAAEILFLRTEDMDPALFGLRSIRSAVEYFCSTLREVL